MRTPVIAIYSDDQTVRQAIASALGSRVAADLPNHSVIEFATGDALRLHLDEKGRVDLFGMTHSPLLVIPTKIGSKRVRSIAFIIPPAEIHEISCSLL